MHLIYAEALLRSGDSSGALTYLNNVPGIKRSISIYRSNIRTLCWKERRKEFFGEGLRFYDLSRGWLRYAFN